jgi:hypothetical protein
MHCDGATKRMKPLCTGWCDEVMKDKNHVSYYRPDLAGGKIESLRFPDDILTIEWYTVCKIGGEGAMDTRPKASQEQRDYLSYLLRLWRESDGDASVWRASLRSSRTRERVGFGSLEELFQFLRKQTGILPNAERGGQEL